MTSPRCSSEGHESLVAQPIEDISSVLGRIFSVRLDVPDIVDGAPFEKKVKEFCVGLLSNPVRHTWWQSIKGLESDARMSISASLFLARKALPCSPDPRQSEKHALLMREPAPAPKTDYCRFVESEIDQLFPIGWDRGYQAHVYSYAPTSSSCLEYSREKGGAKRWLSEQGQDWFADTCLGSGHVSAGTDVRYSVVNTGGKMRGVTVPSAAASVLGPLHRTLYDYLSQFRWLMRGEARGKKFSQFHEVEGEVFVSGDYESATDNLSLEVTELILGRVLSRARRLPRGIVEYALRSLRSTIHYPDGRVVRQERGQLMGSYLSFPLLCLHNYLAFRYFVPRPVPLRINGDDIVFRCRRHEWLKWSEGVKSCGLTLCKGKTLIDKRYFSLNSSFFKAGNRRVWEIPVIRLNPVQQESYPLSGSAFTRFIRGWKCDARRLVGALWLRHRRSCIQATGRSVKALGIPADNSQLHTAGLAPREAFLREGLATQEVPMPRPPGSGNGSWRCIPRTSLVTLSQEIMWQKQFRDWAVEQRWHVPHTGHRELWRDWWGEVKSRGREAAWIAWKSTTKRVHRMGFRLNLRLYCPRYRDREKRMWIPEEFVDALRSYRKGVGAR